MAHKTLNDRETYTDDNKTQLNKEESVSKSKTLVMNIIEKLKGHLKTCVAYEPSDKSLRIHNAPAVEIAPNQLVIAPDIFCETKDGKRFWIEAKDKCQRFYPPDTGADLHQVLGWYKINKYLNEPVLVIFKDEPLEKCSKKNASDKAKKDFENRWNLFNGKMYGAWLDEIIQPTTQPMYPKIFFERSRNIPIYILYFYIQRMKQINNWESILAEIPNSIDELLVYRKCNPNDSLHEIHTEDELEQLSINNLRYIKTETKKYKKNTPFVEIKTTDLENVLKKGLDSMKKAYRNENFELDFFTDELCRRKNKGLTY